MELANRIIEKQEKIAVVGLGYVGLPIAVEFAKKVKVIGFDSSKEKVAIYQSGKDPTQEVGDEVIGKTTLEFTNNETKLNEAKFIIIAVPTPIHSDKTPDLSSIICACETVGRNLSLGSIIVFESTVYPGVTEEFCVPLLEKKSGFQCGKEFFIGYSPERINPGDNVHRLTNIIKIVSGMNKEVREEMAKIYELIIEAGVYHAPSIKVAEAAKLVENAQRDINIAFMNELAMIFERMDICTSEVIAAMNTKWNALKFYPGLVGGHCIGVDPYYFIYQAEKLKFHSQIISSGRNINDNMGIFIADITIKNMRKADKKIDNAKVYVLGITFKENCPDIRNSKVVDIIKRLQEYGVHVQVVDPIANKNETFSKYGITLVQIEEVKDADCIIVAVAHKEFLHIGRKQWESMYRSSTINKKVIIDVKHFLDKEQFIKEDYVYWSL